VILYVDSLATKLLTNKTTENEGADWGTRRDNTAIKGEANLCYEGVVEEEINGLFEVFSFLVGKKTGISK
jgi:hypothetical protein